MVDGLLQWTVIQKIVLNTILVSIPEELFLVMFTLILVGEFEYWKEDECKKLINKWDYPRIIIPVVVSALLSNVLRYGGVDNGISSLVSLSTLFVLIVLTNHIFGDASALKWLGKAFIFLMLAMVILFVSEFIYIPFVVFGTGKDLVEINNNILYNFALIIPARLIQYSILAFFIIKKRSLLQAKILKMIFESRILTIITLISLIINVAFCIINVNVIMFEKILTNLSLTVSLSIVVGVCIFPVINISALAWGIYYVQNRAVLKQKIASEELHKLLEDIKVCTNGENCDNIKWKLNQIGMAIEGISDKLYKLN